MNQRIAERTLLHMIVTSAGGLMDAYSYLLHGKVFATGQTGNFVLLAIHFASFHWSGVFHYLTPILCFWLGIFTAKHLQYTYFSKQQVSWKRGILIIEMLLFSVLAILPNTVSDLLCNSLISFCAAMQFSCFRTFGSNVPYASVFCTGNMRSCAESLYLGIVHKQKGELGKAFRYFGILSSFFIGVLLGVLGEQLWGIQSAFLIVGVLGIAFGLLCFERELKEESI